MRDKFSTDSYLCGSRAIIHKSVCLKSQLSTLSNVAAVDSTTHKSSRDRADKEYKQKMARGDQRERDRAKKQARLAKEAKGGAKVSRNDLKYLIFANI